MATVSRIDSSFDASIFHRCSCAFGVFDGVHKGHRFVIEKMISSAQKNNLRSVILTFDRDPDELFCADKLKKLMSNDERISALASFDVDTVALIPFTREFAELVPNAFLNTFFSLGAPASLHVGCDFRFGVHASGDVKDLQLWGEKHNMLVEAYDLICIDNKPVTATGIRDLLARGDIDRANELLGYSYFVKGEVEPGRREGTNMGFATANLHIPDRLCALADGVYAAYATIENRRYKAAVSVGVSPTFADKTTANMEVHVLDFSSDTYGKTIKVSFEHRLRQMIEFETADDLIMTVTQDIEWVRQNL